VSLRILKVPCLLQKVSEPQEIHGTESFFRSQIFDQLIKRFVSFMENGGSLPCSQELASRPYPEPDYSNPHTHPFYSYPRLSVGFFLAGFSSKFCMLSHISHVCYIPALSHSAARAGRFGNNLEAGLREGRDEAEKLIKK
jgi:hypothetical protein